ncbi:TPA: hypothetical protein EYP44_02345, partial [Candidatus Bathyarchaeota archaeon]|nr:hypothetical protein [Candidatus Bathyarchaeota archaeon]
MITNQIYNSRVSGRMHWIEKVVGELERRGDEKVVLSTGKTPSGHVHVGISRELIYCSAFERLLRDRGLETDFLFFIDSMDPVKRFPPYIPRDLAEYVGTPMCGVPCPEGCCASYAEHFGNLLLRNLGPFGLSPRVIWTHELYRRPEMQDLIRKTLRDVDAVRQILIDVVGPTLAPARFERFKTRVRSLIPCQVVC